MFEKFTNLSKLEQVKQRCSKYKQEINTTAQITDEQTNVAEVSFNTFAMDILADYAETVEVSASLEQEDPAVEKEIREYMQEKAPLITVNILNWWSERIGQFPLLSNLARFVLAIPASSAAPERNFSAAGFVVSERRSHLSSSTIEDILICNSNSDLCAQEQNI